VSASYLDLSVPVTERGQVEATDIAEKVREVDDKAGGEH